MKLGCKQTERHRIWDAQSQSHNETKRRRSVALGTCSKPPACYQANAAQPAILLRWKRVELSPYYACLLGDILAFHKPCHDVTPLSLRHGGRPGASADGHSNVLADSCETVRLAVRGDRVYPTVFHGAAFPEVDLAWNI